METVQDFVMDDSEAAKMEGERLKRLAEAGIDELAVIKDARDNIDGWNSFFNENIVRGKDDMNFCVRDQWTAIERSEFTRLFKPAMTFNKIYDAVKKIVGEFRKNKPDLMVRSLTGKSTQEQINLRTDLVRTISYKSQNDLIYQHAFKCALMMGYGAFQVDVDYENPKSFAQAVKFNLIVDPIMTAFDPCAQMPHKGDGNFCAYMGEMSIEKFDATYPYIINPVSYTDPNALLDFQWQTQETIIVCDYYVKEWYPTILYKLSDGRSVTEDEWEKLQSKIKMQKELAKDSQVVGKIIADQIPTIVAKRQTENYRIMHYRLTKDKIVDFREWPSKYLPIIYVDGDSTFINGKQYTKSFIHEARDAQKFINYVGSEIAAEIKNRRREQWIGTPDNIIGNEQMWRNTELQNGILLAKPDQKTGQMPTKMPPWDLSPALLTQFQRGTMDIKEILGFHEELEGRETNAQSGVAIARRQMAGGMSYYVYQDNMNQALEQAGRVVLDLLPVVVGDDERVMNITKPDGKTRPIVLNKRLPNGNIENQISAGDYDIEIDAGPSFAVQKEASIEIMMQLVTANPQIFPMLADLIAKNLDLQYMPQIAERLQSLVPPQILAKENGEPPPPPPPPSPQEQAMQMELQLQQQQLMDRAHELQIRQQKHELEKVELMMKAKELEEKSRSTAQDRQLQMQKADMDYTTQITKTLADLHKHFNPQQREARK